MADWIDGAALAWALAGPAVGWCVRGRTDAARRLTLQTHAAGEKRLEVWASWSAEDYAEAWELTVSAQGGGLRLAEAVAYYMVDLDDPPPVQDLNGAGAAVTLKMTDQAHELGKPPSFVARVLVEGASAPTLTFSVKAVGADKASLTAQRRVSA